ncbi:MAG: tyrosine-type recombinase/integrase [Candidatus Dormibacteraceae bacterium]
MSDRCRVRMSGPLLPLKDGFWMYLIAQGYMREPAESHVRRMAQLSRWLGRRHLEVGGLTEQAIQRFLRARRRDGYVTVVSTRILGPLLEFLRTHGAPRPALPIAVTPVEVLLTEYRDYLVGERGLVLDTVSRYIDGARPLLAEWTLMLPAGLERLTAEQVTAFVLRECDKRTVESAKTMVGGLRSLLRFLFAKGRIQLPLAEAVPTVAWRRRALPSGLDPESVARLLSGCDQRTGVGRRDFAILLLLVRLGLRAGEAAALSCDDVNWRAGELLIRASKVRRVDRLPLPSDVGDAMVSYLQEGRPLSKDRAVFLRVYAPRVGLTSQGIRQVVRHACVRAGLPECGAHRLRYTAAGQLLRAGATLAEIAQVLRHRSVTTTATYAKVDRSALATLALPWPGGAA